MKLKTSLYKTTLVIPLLTIFFLFSFVSEEEEPTLVWLTDFEQAKLSAVEKDKVILMSFSGSDWCVNCMKLEKMLFESTEFSAYAKESLVLLKLDFPSKKKNQLSPEQQKHNNLLAEKYNKSGQFPTVILLDSEGTIIGKLKHPQSSAGAYIKGIKELIK